MSRRADGRLTALLKLDVQRRQGPLPPQHLSPPPGLSQSLKTPLSAAAFRERRKIHDIVLEGIRLALGKRSRKQ
jgi:hypothetical protein